MGVKHGFAAGNDLSIFFVYRPVSGSRNEFDEMLNHDDCSGGACAQVRRVNFNMGKPFTLTAAYDEEADLPSGCSSEIGTFKVKPAVLL